MARIEGYSDVLEHLDIRREVIAAQARFYMSYAQMLERARHATRRTNVRSESGDVWTRIANPAQPWLGGATIASTYRLASQYAALIDMPMAMRLAVCASLSYLEEGLPFGLFLAAGLLGDPILQHPAVAPRLLGLVSEADAQPPSADPVQRAYLLLALASRPWLQQQLGESADDILNHLAAHDLHPVGPQSTPLAAYLDLARTMLSHQASEPFDHPQGQEARQLPDNTADGRISTMARHLADIGRSQASSLRMTMRNQYLWHNAAAPVNVLDLEQVALYGLAMRSGGNWSEQLLPQTTGLLEGNDVLAELTAWACNEMSTIQLGMTDEIIQILRLYSWNRDA